MVTFDLILEKLRLNEIRKQSENFDKETLFNLANAITTCENISSVPQF